MFWSKWWNKRKLRKKIGITVGMQITTCKDCDKYSKAIEIYDLFDWSTCFKAIGYDKETNEILLVEEQVMRIIQMVNPAQQPRKIRLVSQDELWNRR